MAKQAKPANPVNRLNRPTIERLKQAEQRYYETGGDQRSGYRYTMLDSPLGRCYRRKKLSADEYSALCKYALHWHVAGLQGHLGSVDPNRIAAATSGLTGSEMVADHKAKYYAAKQYIGRHRAYVADAIACHERTVEQTGQDLGYQSPYRGRKKATELLQEAGDQLGIFLVTSAVSIIDHEDNLTMGSFRYPFPLFRSVRVPHLVERLFP